MRRWLLPLCSTLLFSACSTPEQRANLAGFQDWGTWQDYRITKEEVRADEELRGIQAQIDEGQLPKVQFDFDSDKIRPESYRTLDVVSDWFLRHPHLKLRVRAHTCSIGTEQYNLTLSERRAKSVKTYLVQQGLPPPSIRYKGVGYSEPVVDNATEEHREKNRRVEFTLVARDWDSVY